LKYEVSYTAVVWGVWIIVWTSPPILTAILKRLATKENRENQDHYSAVYQSHSAKNRPRNSPDIRKTVNNTAYYVLHLYTVCQAFALVNVAGPRPLPPATYFSLCCKALGWFVCIMGFAGALWSRLNLGSEWRGAPEVRDDHKLITTGPYAFARHPIYTSLFLMQIGSCLTTLYWLSFLELSAVVCAYWYKAATEEKMLVQHFGKKYQQYQKDTWMLMPLIY